MRTFFFFFRKTALSKILFSNPFPRKKRSDYESQKSLFGFDPKNPKRMWILWIHDPLLDLSPQKRKIRFWIRKSGFGFSHKKAPYANIF